MFRTVRRPFSIEAMAHPYVQNFTKNYAFDGESHDFIEIVFIENGRAEVAENDKIYLLDDGNLIFHAPMEFHRIKSADGTEPTVYNLSLKISGKVPDTLFDGVFELDGEERRKYISIRQNAAAFITGESTDPYDGQEAAAMLEAFIIDICAKNKKSNNLSSDAGALMYRRLVRTMKERLYDNISLSRLAADNYISVSYEKSLFYRYAGTSPGSYYARLRANEAARLIAFGTPIARVSEMMNFSSPNYFSLFFKKQTGMTPSQFKRNTQGKEPTTVLTMP